MDLDNNPETRPVITNTFDDGVEIFTKNIEDFPSSLPERQELLTSAEHEIVIELNMHVLSLDHSDPAAPPSNKQMYNNNYWIPVPSGQNLDHYILSFIDHFEKCMTNSINKE